jgi:hypothetical protein
MALSPQFAEPEANGYRDYLLAELRVLSARLRADLLEVDTIGVALKGGFISAEDAVMWLRELGLSEQLGMYRIAHQQLNLPAGEDRSEGDGG